MYQKQERLGSNKLGPQYVSGESLKRPIHYSLTLDRNNLQEWVPTIDSPLILFWTKDAWTRANGDSSYSINQLLSPLLCLEPHIGLLVIVVWRDGDRNTLPCSVPG